MKKLLIVCTWILLMFPAMTFGWYESGHWQEYECDICGKSIYVWQEAQIFPYMPSMTYDGWDLLDHGKERANELHIEQTVRLCNKCYKEYGPVFRELTVKFILKKHKENVELVKKHKKEKRLRKIERKKQQIESLEEQLQRLSKP